VKVWLSLSWASVILFVSTELGLPNSWGADVFLGVPISTSFGRRPAYIFSQLINIASAIWRARAKTYGSFMGACVLNGIGAGPAETVQPAVIADIFFLHDRGTWNTLYWVSTEHERRADRC